MRTNHVNNIMHEDMELSLKIWYLLEKAKVKEFDDMFIVAVSWCFHKICIYYTLSRRAVTKMKVNSIQMKISQFQMASDDWLAILVILVEDDTNV